MGTCTALKCVETISCHYQASIEWFMALPKPTLKFFLLGAGGRHSTPSYSICHNKTTEVFLVIYSTTSYFRNMANKTLDTVKEKVNGVLSKYPVIDEPLSKVADNLKIDKAFIVIAIAVTVPVLIYSLYTGGTFVM